MKTTLLIPTLNEVEGAKVIMPRIKREWVDEIIIIDGHSTDGTREYFEDHGYTVMTQKAPGPVNAWWEGFQAARGDIIIPFSPDNNSIPEKIPELIDKMKEGYDMVIVSRYKDGAKSYDDNWFTGFGNFMATRIINILFGGRYTDALVMYRAFKKELLSKLELDRDKDSIFEVSLSIRCARRGLKTSEIGGDEPRRIGGADSRAHPGIFGRLRGAFSILQCVIKELLRVKSRKSETRHS